MKNFIQLFNNYPSIPVYEKCWIILKESTLFIIGELKGAK
jgi:hypothetical protein